MSLKRLESKSLKSYFNSGPVFSAGDWFAAQQHAGDSPEGAIVYYDRLDVMLLRGLQVKTGTDIELNMQWDPLGIDNTAPLARWEAIIGGRRPSRMAVGEWDREANTQNVYAGQEPPNEIWPFDMATLNMTDPGASLFPWNWTYGPSEASIGGWTEGSAGDFAHGNFVWFETWGYAIRGAARVRHTDNNLYRGLALIKISDGKATLLDVPTVFTTAPRALFEAPEFNGETFTLGNPQFVPDDDTLPAAPKGRLFLFSQEYIGDGVVANSNDHKYLKVIDWNPLDVSPAPGTPNRVHLREILMTRINYIQIQAFGTNPNSLGDFAVSGPAVYKLKAFYHPPTRTILMHNDTMYVFNQNDRGIVRHAITPELYQMEPPTQQEEVETNKSVTFKARGMGDIADPVAGITTNWALERRSTIEEQLDTSGAPVSNFVAHPPIDPDSLIVEYNGTPLTLTTDYTVNETTGEITWQGTHSPPAASGYTATYGHSTVGAQPPHGSLLQETSETDEEGIAETRVQYPDDDELAGDLDYLTATMSDD